MRRPLQNRVTPFGEIVALVARGTMMGNRGGCLHDAEGRLGRRRCASRRWICCVLDFKGRHRQVITPGRYMELFFLDEATALAAGHRPCAECSHADYRAFQDACFARRCRCLPAPTIWTACYMPNASPSTKSAVCLTARWSRGVRTPFWSGGAVSTVGAILDIRWRGMWAGRIVC